MEQTKRIIEVGGVKLEIDTRYAKEINEYRVGDAVKVLVKSYGDNYNAYSGIIAGFHNFKERPSIAVAYLDVNYGGSDIKVVYINKDTKEIEICPLIDCEANIDKAESLVAFDREIAKKRMEIAEIENKKVYFLNNFGRFFSEGIVEEVK